MEGKKHRPQYGIAILVILHLVGLVGLSMASTRELFMTLSPANLLVSFGVVLAFQKSWNTRLVLFWAFVFGVGFGVEVLGVAGGTLFGGEYSYGGSLGPQIGGVPLLMGLNWLLLIYGIGELSRWLLPAPKMWLFRVILGALLMVLIDLFIEPLAPDLGFWAWAGGEIPLINYLTWFGISLGFFLIYNRVRTDRINAVAAALYLIQLAFFMLLGLFL